MFPTLRRVWLTLAGERLRYGAAIGALILASCFLYLAPLIPQAVLDGVLVEDPGRVSGFTRSLVDALGGAEAVRARLWVPALLFLGLSALAGVFTHLRSRWAADASQSIVRRIRDRAYDQLQHLPCRTLDEADTGDLIQRCTSDVETLRQFLASQVVEIGRALTMLLIPIPLMLAVDARMTAVSLILVPAICGFSFVTFGRLKAAFTAADEAEGRMTTRIQENLTGIRVVRAFNRQAHERALFDAVNEEHRELDHRLYVLLARFWALSDLLCFAQKGLVVGVGIALILQGSLAVGAFFYFLTAVNLFMWPVRQMGRILTDLGKAVVALERLEEILHEPREEDPERSGVEHLDGTLEFANVSFAHGEQQVLKDVSFRLERGQTLAILGPSGSGKSTIVNLLLRLYDYDQGSIRLGGHELETLERKLVRRNTAVVLQEPFLFSKALGENVRLGAPHSSEEELVAATSAACIHATIEGFAEGYATKVGERGVTLSGGQRQRVALARALLQEPAVLILDDSLSAVDTETEASILRALEARTEKQTTVVIAHRVSTVRHADQVLVLREGRIVQAGTPAELRAVEGPFKRLWEAQTSLEAPPARETKGAARAAEPALAGAYRSAEGA
ncbi:MAG: ABC transporter ATP-binding protein [Planctomycetes bacterium]|nr:ABC transporter ATP-binding protein [Planctomycetota bacterium]